MSEQPRRRRRQIESDDVPQIPQDDFTVMAAEKQITAPIKKPQPQKPKRKVGMAYLASPSAYIVMMAVFIVCFIFDRLSLDEKIPWQSLLYYSSISMALVLLTTSTFIFNAKKERVRAIISAAIASALCIYVFMLRYIPLYMNSETLRWRQLKTGISLSLPYIALLIFAIMKKKRRNIWIAIGAAILLFQIVPPFIFESPVKWINTSFGYNTIGRLMILRGSLGNEFRLYRLFDLVYGLVFFFGMINVPGKKRTSDKVYNTNDYPLLEQYKREHGM